MLHYLPILVNGVQVYSHGTLCSISYQVIHAEVSRIAVLFYGCEACIVRIALKLAYALFAQLKWMYCSQDTWNTTKRQPGIVWKFLEYHKMLYKRMLTKQYYSIFQELYRVRVLLRSVTWLILDLCPANERRRYKITPSLIDWAQTENPELPVDFINTCQALG